MVIKKGEEVFVRVNRIFFWQNHDHFYCFLMPGTKDMQKCKVRLVLNIKLFDYNTHWDTFYPEFTKNLMFEKV